MISRSWRRLRCDGPSVGLCVQLFTSRTCPSRYSPDFVAGAARYSTSLPQSMDILDRYRGMVATGKIQYDEEQIRVIMRLRRIQKDLVDYTPAMVAPDLLASPETSSAWWNVDEVESPDLDPRAIVSLKTQAEELSTLATPKGLLLTGPPGCGKSMLVDLWLSCIPTPYKTRKHYNQLVLEIYRGVWEETQRRMTHSGPHPRSHELERSPWNASIRDTWRELAKTGRLPLAWRRGITLHPGRSIPTIAFSVARRLVLRHWLLVFDEIQLLDISSATLLADVLSWYWRMGGVIVGTSNKVPDDIYRHGVQRERLEPFVEGLKVRCPVLVMRSERDWRRHQSSIDSVGRTWLLLGQDEQFRSLLKGFSRGELEETHEDLTVFGRHLRVPWSSGGVGQFTFQDLCEDSLGPADYLTLAAHFHTIGISDIPILTLVAKDQARRFISLIDALYEARCRVVCLAATEPEDLFFPDVPVDENADVMLAESISETQDGYRPNVSAYSTSRTHDPIPKAMALDTLSIFSGQEEQFAFKRALSRLIEMTSAAYARNVEWAPLADRDRTWEKSASDAIEAFPRYRDGSPHLPKQDDDFASEAAYTPGAEHTRPVAPRLKADHVWGVRDDWGEKAAAWGRGATAHVVQPKTNAGSGPDT